MARAPFVAAADAAGFQRSEYLLEKGMVDRVVPRKELPNVLGSVLRTLMMGRGRAAA